MPDPLENCPCCNTVVNIEETPLIPVHKYIQCSTCGLNMIGYPTEEELINAWNRRDYVA